MPVGGEGCRWAWRASTWREEAGWRCPHLRPRSWDTGRGDPSESLPGLLGGGGRRAQSVLTDDTSSKPLLPSSAPLTPPAAATGRARGAGRGDAIPCRKHAPSSAQRGPGRGDVGMRKGKGWRLFRGGRGQPIAGTDLAYAAAERKSIELSAANAFPSAAGLLRMRQKDASN